MVGRRVLLRAFPELGAFTVRKIVAVQDERLLCGFEIDNGRGGRRYEVVRKEIRLAR